jgi:hypothetical protein
MTAFSDLQAEVLTNIIDLPTVIQNSVGKYINRAQKRAQIDHNFKIMEGLYEVFTQVNSRIIQSTAPPTQTNFAVPLTFKEFRRDPWFLKNDGSITRMILANKREDIWKSIDEQDINFPMVLVHATETDTLGNGNFWVYPLPDGNSDYTDGEYRVKVPVWVYLASYVNTGDQDWFSNNADIFLVFKATQYGFMANWDWQNAALWGKMAEDEWKTVMKRDKMLRLSTGSETFVPLHHGVNSPRLQW